MARIFIHIFKICILPASLIRLWYECLRILKTGGYFRWSSLPIRLLSCTLDFPASLSHVITSKSVPCAYQQYLKQALYANMGLWGTSEDGTIDTNDSSNNMQHPRFPTADNIALSTIPPAPFLNRSICSQENWQGYKSSLWPRHTDRQKAIWPIYRKLLTETTIAVTK